jgi:DNA-binding transcriptional ArsR family regulator
MVKQTTDSLDSVFGALADPTRRAILARLAQGEATVGELAAPFDMSLPAISKHLTVLEQAGLLRRERDGRTRRCHLEAAALARATGWLEQYRMFWDDALDRLADYLASEQTGKGRG